MSTIIFKKQRGGQWRRDDGQIRGHVNEKTMFGEIQVLVHAGWRVKLHGITHIRSIEVISPEIP